MSALVVCLGNELVADDGAGAAVYRELETAALPNGVELHLMACGAISLLDQLQGQDLLVVVDAVQLGQPPGCVRVMDWNAIPESGPAVSAHGIGVREAVDLVRVLDPGRAPRRVALVGIEGACFDALGRPPVREVMEGAGRAARIVRQMVANVDGPVRTRVETNG